MMNQLIELLMDPDVDINNLKKRYTDKTISKLLIMQPVYKDPTKAPDEIL